MTDAIGDYSRGWKIRAIVALLLIVVSCSLHLVKGQTDIWVVIADAAWFLGLVFLLTLSTISITSLRVIFCEHSAIWIWTIIGLILRLYNLNTLPFGLWNDEPQAISDAMQILSGNYKSVMGVGEFGVSYLYSFLILPFLIILPDHSILAGKLPGALCGTLMIPTLYFVLTVLTKDKKLGLIAAALLSLSCWQITLSRYVYRFQIEPLLSLMSILFLFIAFEKRSLKTAILAGVSMGLNLIFLYIGAINLLVTSLIGIFYLVICRRQLITTFQIFSTYLFSTLIIFLPKATVAVIQATNSDGFDKYESEINTFIAFGNPIETITQNFLAVFKCILLQGTGSARYLPGINLALITPIESLLFLIGILWALIKINRKENIFFLANLVLMSLPYLINLEGKSYRLLGTAPSIFYFCAVGLVFFSSFLDRIKFSRKITSLIQWLIVLAIGGLNIHYARAHFQDKATFWYENYQGKRKLVGQEIKKLLDNGYKVYTTSDISQYVGTSVVIYPHQIRELQILNGLDSIPIFPSPKENRIAIFLNIYYTDQFPESSISLVNSVRHYYPNLTVEEILNPDGLAEAVVLKGEDNQIKSESGFLVNNGHSTALLLMPQATTIRISRLPENCESEWKNGSEIYAPRGYLPLSFPCSITANEFTIEELKEENWIKIEPQRYLRFTPKPWKIRSRYYANEDCTGIPLYEKLLPEVFINSTSNIPPSIKCIELNGNIKGDRLNRYIIFQIIGGLELYLNDELINNTPRVDVYTVTSKFSVRPRNSDNLVPFRIKYRPGTSTHIRMFTNTGLHPNHKEQPVSDDQFN